METCSDNHETVAFVGSHWNQCPVCPIVQENNELQEAVSVKDSRIEELESELEELQNDI